LLGIAAGELVALNVGGVNNNWEWLVAGLCLSQLDSAVEASKEGEVVVSGNAWKLVRGSCKGLLQLRNVVLFFNSKLEGIQIKPPDWHVTEISKPVKITGFQPLVLKPAIEHALRCHIQKGVQDCIDR
jgi:hypothetical protein